MRRSENNTSLGVYNSCIYVGLTNVSGSTNVSDSPKMFNYVIFPQTRSIFTTNASDLVGGKTSTTLTS